MAGVRWTSTSTIQQTSKNVNTGTKTPHEDNLPPQQQQQQKHTQTYPNRVRHLTDMTRTAHSKEQQSSKLHHKGHRVTNPTHTNLDTDWTFKILGA
jgi:hypothetical protein